MAIYHCSIKNIGRSSGRSAVASSAYRSGEKLEDKETGLTHDYTRKKGIEYTEIILCKNAPEEYADRATLWNEVQKVEKASDARLAREWELAIPRELSLEQGQKLVHDFAQSLADEGMCVDVAIHDKGDGNRHAHILGTTRPIKENGQWGQKEKKDYALDENGERIPVINQETGQQKLDSRNRKQWKRITVQANDWNKTEKVEEWRERWARECNKYLEKDKQVDHRSFKRQGKEQLPTIHEGYAARQIQRRTGMSELCQINKEIKSTNTKLQLLQKQQRRLSLMSEQLKEKILKSKEDMKAIYERYRRFIDDRTMGRTVNNSGEAGTGNPEMEGLLFRGEQMEREIEQRERPAAAREQEIERREQEVDRIGTEIKQREYTVEQRERPAAARKQEIEQREQEVNRINTEIKQRESEEELFINLEQFIIADEFEEQLEPEKSDEEELQELEQQLNEYENIFADWRKRRDLNEQSINKINGEIAKINYEFEKVREENRVKQEQIEELKQQIAECGMLQGRRKKSLSGRLAFLESIPDKVVEDSGNKQQLKEDYKNLREVFEAKKVELKAEFEEHIEAQNKIRSRIEELNSRIEPDMSTLRKNDKQR